MADDTTFATGESTQKKSTSGAAADPAMAKKYPVLVELITATESMNSSEKEYWFQLLPMMTDEQIKNLQNILEGEKKKLTEIDKKYEKKMEKITQKYISKWTGTKRQEQLTHRAQEETTAQKESGKKADDLLGGLD